MERQKDMSQMKEQVKKLYNYLTNEGDIGNLSKMI